MRPLAPRERRIVALGLLATATAAVWLLVFAPLLGGFQARTERRQQLIARYQADQRLLASIPALRAEASAQRRSAGLFQITAPTRALASDALKRRLTATLTEAGGVVNAVQDVQADIPPGWISVRADALINLTQVAKSIRSLENEAPYVVVDYASIGADSALHSGHSAPLDIRLQISAAFHPASPR